MKITIIDLQQSILQQLIQWVDSVIKKRQVYQCHVYFAVRWVLHVDALVTSIMPLIKYVGDKQSLLWIARVAFAGYCSCFVKSTLIGGSRVVWLSSSTAAEKLSPLPSCRSMINTPFPELDARLGSDYCHDYVFNP